MIILPPDPRDLRMGERALGLITTIVCVSLANRTHHSVANVVDSTRQECGGPHLGSDQCQVVRSEGHRCPVEFLQNIVAEMALDLVVVGHGHR